MELDMQSHGLGGCVRNWMELGMGSDGIRAGNGIPWIGEGVGGILWSWEWDLAELQLGMGSDGLGCGRS